MWLKLKKSLILFEIEKIKKEEFCCLVILDRRIVVVLYVVEFL